MKKQTAFRLSQVSISLLDAIASKEGLNRTETLEMLIREAAINRKIQLGQEIE